MIRQLSILSIILIFTTGLSAQPIDSSRLVRVFTYNILHGATMNGDFDLDLISSVIKSCNPDLVALQEVDYKTNRARKMDLATELGYRTQMAPLFGRAMYYDDGEYGEGLLSKYTFINTTNHPLPFTEGKEPRAALEVTFALASGDTVCFVGTHLDHESNDYNRQSQADEINLIYAKTTLPTILAGDLNATPESKVMQSLFKFWTPAFTQHLPTYPSTNPKKKIDYILYKPAKRWRILSKKVICDEIASDHCGVLVILELLK
jgi:endonuclease/exonuclease/phosphatase family metal-dependent hydrolase